MRSEDEIKERYLEYFKEWQTTEDTSIGYNQFIKGYAMALDWVMEEDNQ